MNDSQRLFAAQYGKLFPIKVEDIPMSKEKPKSKTLARHGSLDEYVDSLPAHKRDAIKDKNNEIKGCIQAILENAGRSRPVIDDTFNDDTVAQTFGDIGWDMGTQDRAEEVVVVPCPGCDRAVPYDNHGAFFLVGNMAVCSDCYVRKNKMRLIGIAGPARAGKDTLARYLLDNLSDDWTRSSFADPLKEMLQVIGVDCSDEAKAVVDDVFGITPRLMMQTLGTEWGCHMINGDIWVKAFAHLNAGKCVIVPDVRFENEAALVREHGVLIHLTGRGGIEGNHVSENPIEFKEGDIVIDNSRDLAWLHAQIDGNAVLSGFIEGVDK